MKLNNLRQQKGLQSLFLAILLGGMLSSCNTINEPEGDCPNAYKVTFTHTLNIDEEDLFGPKVTSISLFIFDNTGNLVKCQTETSDAILTNNYTMILDVPDGQYDLIAWGGIQSGDSFTLTELESINTKEDLVCRLERIISENGESISNQNINDIFHGMALDVTFPKNQYDAQVATIDLKKNTNSIKVVLYRNGDPLDASNYNFSITDNNGLLNYDNTLLDDEPIQYREWTKYNTTFSLSETTKADDRENINAVAAELKVSRLMENHNPILRVTDDSGTTMIQLPLIDLLLTSKGEAKSEMSDQEYLDRQDEFSISFQIDDSNFWYKKSGVFVNGWKLLFQDSDL